MTQKQAEQEESKTKLRKWLPPGSTVYCVRRHVSRSGMACAIDFYSLEKGTQDGRICKLWLSYHVAKVLGWRFHQKHEAVWVEVCGMDRGFHVVHELSYALHGMKDVGRKAIEAGKKGRPYQANKRSYRAGYSLECEWI